VRASSHKHMSISSQQSISKLDALYASIEASCAKEIIKMSIEMRAAAVREEVKKNKASEMVQNPYYSNPTLYLSISLRVLEEEKDIEDKKRDTICIYRYIIKEFTYRFQGRGYRNLRRIFRHKAEDLVDQGMDDLLMYHFRRLIPRQLRR
jgi:hypothetical protein